MIIYTGRSDRTSKRGKERPLTELRVDEGERVGAVARMKTIVSDTKRYDIYLKKCGNIPDAEELIERLECLYVQEFEPLERDNISDITFHSLQLTLAPEYYLNIISIFICTRYNNNFPGMLSLIREDPKYKLCDIDKTSFKHFFEEVYLPSITLYLEESKGFRPRAVVRDEFTDVLKQYMDMQEIDEVDYAEKSQAYLEELAAPMRLLFECVTRTVNDLDESEYDDADDNAGVIADEITQKYAIRYPDMFKMGNSLLQNKMSLSAIPYTERDEARALTVQEKKGSADIFVSLSPDDDTVELSKPLDPFDIAVLDSVATLINSGNMAFTAPMVYRVMRGFDGGANLKDYDSPETIAHIEQSLENMRHIWARIDYTEQAQKREKTKSKGKKYIVDGYLLQCTRAAVEINGKFVNSAYVATGQSPLHLYNMAIKQMLTIPSKLIDLKGAVNVNERAMLIARYLLRRIYTANYGQGYKISIETLCKEIGEPDATDKQIRSIKGTAEKLLIHWSTSESLKEISPLKGYSVYKIGKKVAGFNLNLRDA